MLIESAMAKKYDPRHLDHHEPGCLSARELLMLRVFDTALGIVP
jgi:hypothetical protein